MEISQFPQLTTQIALRSSNEFVKAWEVGQLLRARVVVDEGSQQRVIDINGTRVKAEGQLPFSPGQSLSLRVEQIGSKPILRVIPTLSVLQAQQQINQAIRTVIANQSPVNALLPVLTQSINAIQHLPNSVGAGSSRLDADLGLELKKAAQKVRDTIPLLAQLRQAPAVKQQSLNSGSFFEAKLAVAAASPNTLTTLTTDTLSKDIKPLLLQLVAAIRHAITNDAKLAPQLLARLEEQLTQTDTKNKSTADARKSDDIQARFENLRQQLLQPLQQLLKTSESLLSRIQLNQLSSLLHSSESNQIWYLEIPYAHNNHHHALQLRISRENSRTSHDTEQIWHIEFSFELGKHGSVLSEVKLKDKNVNLRFSAETESGLRLLREHIHLLQDKLRMLGFEVNMSQAQRGEIPDLLRPNTLNNLLDTHA